MDHKISKDMISSGMIPSGEKTQADLGRTQYGSTPSPSTLMDAYKAIYEHHKKDADGNTIPHEGEELNEALPLAPLAVAAGGLGTFIGGSKLMYDAFKDKNKKKKPDTPSTQSTPSKPVSQMNDVDLFDLIKGKLIDEGCEEKEAIKIMVSLSEEELNEILGGVKGDGYIGHPRLNIKNPLNPPKKEKKKTESGKGLFKSLGNRATDIENMLK